jgi:glycosyltransferase involved in cell wall biosynthesis
MNIAFVTLGLKPLRTSGFDIAGEHLVDALLNAGHQITVVAGKKDEQEESITHPNLKIHRIKLDRLDWFSFAYRAARLVENLGPFDAVHFYDISFSYAYRGKYVASLQHSFRQRVESLGSFHWKKGTRWLLNFLYYSIALLIAEKPALKKAAGLLASSSSAYSEYLKHYAIEPAKITLARHCIDAEFYRRPSSGNQNQMRRSLCIDSGTPVILFAGFITPRKGLEYLARALVEISPPPCLLIIGKWRNLRYRRGVYTLLEPFRERVIETGFVPDEMMPAYYSLADVYVSPSLMEGFGLPLGEALACGTPVVAFDAGAVAEVVGPGGILVPPRDVKGLAEAVSYLLQNPDIRNSMAAKGRDHIVREFSVSKMLEATLEAYERFLDVKRSL